MVAHVFDWIGEVSVIGCPMGLWYNVPGICSI